MGRTPRQSRNALEGNKSTLKNRQQFKRRIDRAFKERNELLALRLHEGREAADLRKNEARQMFGRDQSFISRLENGLQIATFVEVARLVAIYGMKFPERTHVSRLRL